MDISSKQSLQAAFINFHDEKELPEKMIEIASENCFYDSNDCKTKAMVFLRWREYRGRIKFVSKDSFTVIKEFWLVPDDPVNPLRFF